MKTLTSLFLSALALTLPAFIPDVRGQTTPTVTTLHSFKGGTEGEAPFASLVQGSDGNFYGTTSAGGSGGSGTVFRITPAGVNTTLHNFSGTGTGGAQPYAGLVQGSDGNFYGTTRFGGSSGSNGGTVFKITPAGVLTILYNSFTGGTGGDEPVAGLVQGSDGNFYGTTEGQVNNSADAGTVFKITPTGVLTTLHSFTATGTD